MNSNVTSKFILGLMVAGGVASGQTLGSDFADFMSSALKLPVKEAQAVELLKKPELSKTIAADESVRVIARKDMKRVFDCHEKTKKTETLSDELFNETGLDDKYKEHYWKTEKLVSSAISPDDPDIKVAIKVGKWARGQGVECKDEAELGVAKWFKENATADDFKSVMLDESLRAGILNAIKYSKTDAVGGFKDTNNFDHIWAILMLQSVPELATPTELQIRTVALAYAANPDSDLGKAADGIVAKIQKEVIQGEKDYVPGALVKCRHVNGNNDSLTVKIVGAFLDEADFIFGTPPRFYGNGNKRVDISIGDGEYHIQTKDVEKYKNNKFAVINALTQDLENPNNSLADISLLDE